MVLKESNDQTRNFTIEFVFNDDATADIDIKASSAKEAIRKFWKNPAIKEDDIVYIVDMYDEGDVHYDFETGEELEEGLTLKEAAGSDYKVFTLSIDVAFPEGKTPRDYGVDSSVPGAQLFKELSKALETLGLEMAGDYVSQEAEVTDVYKDNDYEFFEEDPLESKVRV